MLMEDRWCDLESDDDKRRAAGEDHEQLSHEKFCAEATAQTSGSHPVPMR